MFYERITRVTYNTDIQDVAACFIGLDVIKIYHKRVSSLQNQSLSMQRSDCTFHNKAHPYFILDTGVAVLL